MFSFFYIPSSHTSSKSRYISYILMRRYALASTLYKFLNIEILVGSTSHVQIEIGENRGNRMILPLDVTNTMRWSKHVKDCALQNVFKIYNWWSKR
ncbi:hypothetical protein ALC57_05533 [Trachymyrmex cornetzi]|uniref:Uncharacterized protein n=1 Tax=Trachymyrmex cornetzi TaxID=471704 RepID=A0A151JAK2_9HYME|nr:hypothetical protein ALC57_05533 [Trachymyrmex cornetzi]